jgi:flagellar motor switch protein FliM
MNDIIRRKVARGDKGSGPGGTGGGMGGSPGADQGWRLSFARAARDTTGLMVEVAGMTLHRRSLAELLELPPDRALLALLDGPQGGLGLLVMSPEVMSALIEMQTTGRVTATPPLTRRPTRTDAAMVALTIDRALEELDRALAEEADLVWAGGFRYASFLEDPRPLGLLLEDQPYRVLSSDLTMADGARRGGVILALPADGRGQHPVDSGVRPDAEVSTTPGFSAALGEAVMGADCLMEAVLGRLVLPLRQVMDLQVDQVLALPKAALDRISVESADGRRLARAKLGQNKGMRALRLMAEEGGPAVSSGAGTMMAVSTAADPLPVAALSAGAGDFNPGFGAGEMVPMGDKAAPGLDDGFPGFAAPMDLGDGLLAAG